MSKIIGRCIEKKKINNGATVLFQIDQEDLLNIDDLNINDKYDILFKRHAGKRTLSQNSYFWKLVTLISEKWNMSLEDVCYLILTDSRSKYTVIEAPLESEDIIKKKYKFVKFIAKSFNDESKGIFQCFYGTSEMSSIEFGILIDKAEEYCLKLDIPLER